MGPQSGISVGAGSTINSSSGGSRVGNAIVAGGDVTIGRPGSNNNNSNGRGAASNTAIRFGPNSTVNTAKDRGQIENAVVTSGNVNLHTTSSDSESD